MPYYGTDAVKPDPGADWEGYDPAPEPVVIDVSREKLAAILNRGLDWNTYDETTVDRVVAVLNMLIGHAVEWLLTLYPWLKRPIPKTYPAENIVAMLGWS